MEQGYLNGKRKNDTGTWDESIPAATVEVRKRNEGRYVHHLKGKQALPEERGDGCLQSDQASPPCDSLRRAYKDPEGAGLSHPEVL